MALTGSIDATENLRLKFKKKNWSLTAINVQSRNAKVFLYHGSQDEVVNPGILEKIQEFYGYFTTSGEIQSGHISMEWA